MTPHSQPNETIWPLTDTRPNSKLWAFDAPNMKTHPGFNENQYERDLTRFDSMPKRNSFIRESYGEFPPPFGQHLESDAPLLLLWVLVLRAAQGWHVRLPIWRGYCPYTSEPKTDDQVMAIVTECRSQGGYDPERLARWRVGMTELQMRSPR